jgi:D-alanine--(R)-lactate ligase
MAAAAAVAAAAAGSPPATPAKPRLMVLFGGPSEEHDVSVKSAREVAAHIDTTRYEPLYVGITRRGAWRLCDEGPCAGWETAPSRPVLLSPDRETRGALILGEHGFELHRIDVVLPLLHGRAGEDGSLQGLLELSGIPYVGCDVPSSVLCMDKSLAYLIVRAAGIATPAFCLLNGESNEILPFPETPNIAKPPSPPIKTNGDKKQALEGLSYPVFVKPARSGSSFGVRKVEAPEDLDAAIEEARRYDSKVLVEEAISGCEVGCAVLGNGSELIVSEVDQIRLTHGIFRIHQEDEPESGSENAVITIPAPISTGERRRIRETAGKIYRALGCRGLARVDMFLQEDGRIVLNEVNTLPGFTSYSRYPRMMAATGITLSELIDHLVSLALKR